jgi:prepilin-type processing-associated H-X9-DG protein
MKPRLSKKRNAAMTLFEVGVVVAIVMILVVLLLPRIARPRRAYAGIDCGNNLKQVGLAYRIWEGDNGDIYPMGISVASGGSMEMVATGNVLQTFMVMSNELSTPKILFCPEDKTRTWPTAGWPTNEFASLSASNLSYFVGVDVTNDTANPKMFLSGDCNFVIGGVPVKPGLRSFWTNDPIGWTATRHLNPGNYGNIGFADGSVQQMTSTSLRNYLQLTGLATNRFAIP